MTPEKQKMIDELKRLMAECAAEPAYLSVMSKSRRELYAAAVNALPALLEEVEKGPTYEKGVKDGIDAAVRWIDAGSRRTLSPVMQSRHEAILALLPPAPASDDVREE